MTADASLDDFGSWIKKEREARGVSLREIADRTKIVVSALEALERNDLSILPEGIFVRGFVRAYAEEVGLDPEGTVEVFLKCFPQNAITLGSPSVLSMDRRDHPQANVGIIDKVSLWMRRVPSLFVVPLPAYANVEGSRRRLQIAVVLVFILVPTLLGIIYITGWSWPEPSPKPMSSSTSVGLPPVLVEDSPFRVGPLEIEIVALWPVKMRLVADGGLPAQRALVEGARLTILVEQSLSLSVDDAAAVRMTINGEPTVSLGLPAESSTVQINRDTLVSLLAPK